MSDRKRDADEAGRGKEEDEGSKGQYGSLTSLGPGGGTDIADVTTTDEAVPDEEERKDVEKREDARKRD